MARDPQHPQPEAAPADGPLPGALGFRPGYSYAGVRYWLPAVLAGAAAFTAFMLVGQTPLVRAAGLAAVIIGFALALRPMGAWLTVGGALFLAVSPVFWAQTGGAESLDPAAVLAAGLTALAVGAVLWRAAAFMRAVPADRARWWALGAAVAVFALGFFLVFGTPRSLRVTTLASAWVLYLLIDGLFRANPRPDSPPIGNLGVQHTWGLLLVLGIGIANDPLMTLFTPAVALALFLSRHRVGWGFWLLLAALAVFGVWRAAPLYISPYWFPYDARLASTSGLQTPFIIGGAWREPARWLYLIDLLARQFTPLGLALGVLGLARLSRWYPPIGITSLIAYAAFAAFGLVYFGKDSPVLLLPMLMLQVWWMTYAVYTLIQWAQKYTRKYARRAGTAALAPAADRR